jgi:hypothetical protein
MNSVTKFTIAIVLGVAASATNMAWLMQQKKPPSYVGFNQNLDRGTVISAEMLIPVPIPGDPEQVKKSLIPFANRRQLLGTRIPRSIRTGDMCLYADLSLPMKKLDFEVLGPFRIVGVGGAFKEQSINETRIGGGGNNVTIAISPSLDDQSRRLLEILATGGKLSMIQVIPSSEKALTQRALEATQHDNYVHQTISLAGIEHVPSVLYDGAVIQFLLPVTREL